jgi:hypothetical protein
MSSTEFDYIIVGGGSAGCVLANRLTAGGKHRVCLLEAGPEDRSPLIGIPGAFAYFMFSRKYNWSFEAEPASDIRKGDPVFCPQGKGLGGGSAIKTISTAIPARSTSRIAAIITRSTNASCRPAAKRDFPEQTISTVRSRKAWVFISSRSGTANAAAVPTPT